jgi:hypothetical protein
LNESLDSKKDSTNAERKRPFSNLKKAFAPFAGQGSQDPKATEPAVGRRQSLDDQRPLPIPPTQSAEDVCGPNAQEDPKTQPLEPVAASTSLALSFAAFVDGRRNRPQQPQDTDIRELQHYVASFRDLSEFFQERLGKFKREKKISDETTRRRFENLKREFRFFTRSVTTRDY